MRDETALKVLRPAAEYGPGRTRENQEERDNFL